jgi:hypothetical protein
MTDQPMKTLDARLGRLITSPNPGAPLAGPISSPSRCGRLVQVRR